MGEIVFVRHGQASFGGPDYDRLSTQGAQQSTWLGEYFAESGAQFDHVITGTQQRHRQTAAALLAALPNSPTAREDARLNEYDFIALHHALRESAPTDRTDRAAFYRHLKKALYLWAEDRLPGEPAERWTDFQARVRGGLAQLQQCDGQRLLVVSSGGPMGVAVQQTLGAPYAAAIELNLQLRNTAICHFHFNAQGMRLASFNTLPHLDRADRRHAITYA